MSETHGLPPGTVPDRLFESLSEKRQMVTRRVSESRLSDRHYVRKLWKGVRLCRL